MPGSNVSGAIHGSVPTPPPAAVVMVVPQVVITLARPKSATLALSRSMLSSTFCALRS